jgi:hypothetical protein
MYWNFSHCNRGCRDYYNFNYPIDIEVERKLSYGLGIGYIKITNK